MRTQRETTLVDDYGDDHTYSLIQHPASESFDLLSLLIEICGEPVIVALLGDGSEERDVDIEGLKAAASDMSAEVELSLRGDLIGPQVTTLVRRLMSAGGHGVILSLLKYTTRDDQQMAKKAAFDAAYQGNLGEMIAAVRWALTENFGASLGRFKRPTRPAPK